MRRCATRPLLRFVGLGLLVAAAPGPWVGTAAAATIGYWRMEADLDARPQHLEVANEVAFGSSLLSGEAFVDTLANPNGTVPLTGSPNAGSLGATRQGGNRGINGTVAWYPELDAASLTVEFWARTGENQATLFSRSSGSDGVEIGSPSALTVTYWVEDGAGGATSYQLVDVFDMDTTWRHFVFAYDADAGVARFLVDGTVVAQRDGPDGRALVWGHQVDAEVGRLMDFAGAYNGTLDELRLQDAAYFAPAGEGLLIAEPGVALLLVGGLAGFLALPRRRAG